MQPRDDQPGELLALAHQHHDVARPARRAVPRRAFDEREAIVQPCSDLPRDLVGQLALGLGEPALRGVFLILGFALTLTFAALPHRPPQRDEARALLAHVLLGGLVEPEAGKADGVDGLVDEIEHRLPGAERAVEPEFKQLLRRLVGAQGQCIVRRAFHRPPHALGGLAEVFGAGALEAENRLLVVANDEQRAHPRQPRWPSPEKNSVVSASMIRHCAALVSCASSTRM